MLPCEKFPLLIAGGVDFLAIPDSELVFSLDQNERNITITIIDDNVTEGIESFTAVISEAPMSGVMVSITDPTSDHCY